MNRPRVAVLASGGGTTFENLVARSRDGRLDAEIVLVLASRPDARAVVRARNHGVACEVLPQDLVRDPSALGAAIGDALDRARADLCVMAGFLRLWTIPPHWRGRVMNIHPALLPAFGGKGMYGHHVHEAVVASGVRVTGCTVHYADDIYDHGPIVLQLAVPVAFEDTPDDVARRVFGAECEAYPEAIALHAAGRLRVEGRRVRILPA